MLKVFKLNENATLPKRKTNGAAGYDLYCVESVTIKVNERRLIPTGLIMQIPEGVFGKIYTRSGNCLKHGLDEKAGVIDSDYRGELMILLVNNGQKDVILNPKEAIGQIVFSKYENLEVKECDKLDDTERGIGGFGSTNGK